MSTLRAEMKVLRAEWSDWGERHVRRSREGSGRAVREAAEIQWAEKVRAKAVARAENGAVGNRDMSGVAA